MNHSRIIIILNWTPFMAEQALRISKHFSAPRTNCIGCKGVEHVSTAHTTSRSSYVATHPMGSLWRCLLTKWTLWLPIIFILVGVGRSPLDCSLKLLLIIFKKTFLLRFEPKFLKIKNSIKFDRLREHVSNEVKTKIGMMKNVIYNILGVKSRF